MKISRENLNFVSSISGNTYILAFLHIEVISIPGNFRKGGAQISTKIKNWGRHVSGKNLIFHLENFGKHVYSCIFTSCVDHNSREFQKKGVPDFRENWKFWRTPGNFGIFAILDTPWVFYVSWNFRKVTFFVKFEVKMRFFKRPYGGRCTQVHPLNRINFFFSCDFPKITNRRT